MASFLLHVSMVADFRDKHNIVPQFVSSALPPAQDAWAERSMPPFGPEFRMQDGTVCPIQENFAIQSYAGMCVWYRR
jgi:hypothetical protein